MKDAYLSRANRTKSGTSMTSDKNTFDDMKDVLARMREILSAVSYAVEARNLEDVLQRIAEVSRQLVHARYAALGVPDGEGGLLHFKTAGMSPDELARMNSTGPVGAGLIGVLMRDRVPLRIEDMSRDMRSAGFCPGHPIMTSLLGVPIQVGTQLFGTLYLCDREDNEPFSEYDQQTIELLAGYAALAIAGVHLSDQQSRIALLEERDRIAMELHDGIIQSLYAIGMQLELARSADKVKASDLTGAIAELDNVIDDIRDYILNLRISSYQQQTIYECLNDLISRLHVPDGLSIKLDAPYLVPPFSPVTMEAMCQITNEALSNAVRHAEAHHIQVVAQLAATTFSISIADDGKGFNLDEIIHNHTGLGLRNIQQRARLHNGTVQIDTASGKGTTLTITVPLKHQ